MGELDHRDFGLLTPDTWLDQFYKMNIWVKNVSSNPEFYLDKTDIKNVIPELLNQRGDVMYHKVCLINLLKIKCVLSDLERIKTRLTYIEELMGSLDKIMDLVEGKKKINNIYYVSVFVMICSVALVIGNVIS